MLRVERAGPVLVLTLSDPARHNPQTPALWRDLAAVGAALEPDVRAVLVQGDGPSFSAGLDRRMFTPEGVPGEPDLLTLGRTDPEQLDATIGSFQAGFAWLADPAVVTVAAVQGHAIGAGFQLALACDLRVVATDVSFAMRETTLGLVPDLTGTWPLVHALGYPRALELCLTGRAMGAEEAVATGLAVRAVPAADLRADAHALIESLLVGPPRAVRATTALLQDAAERSPESQRAAERAAQAGLLRAIATELEGMP